MTGPVAMILAGGASRRMGGGDKGLLPLGRSTVLGQVADRVEPQVARLALNANGDAARFAALRLPVLADVVPDQPGPLAGILTAMHWARGLGASTVITCPGDTPFLPGDLVPHLMLAAEGAASGVAIAESSGRQHPVCGLWPVALAEELAQAIDSGMRKVMDWAEAQAPGIARFPSGTPDPFFNINTPDDLAAARGFL